MAPSIWLQVYFEVLHESLHIRQPSGRSQGPGICSALQVKFAKSGSAVVVRIEVEKMICAELFKNVPQLGRFTLRDEGRTIAIGKIIKLPKSLKETTAEAK